MEEPGSPQGCERDGSRQHTLDPVPHSLPRPTPSFQPVPYTTKIADAALRLATWQHIGDK